MSDPLDDIKAFNANRGPSCETCKFLAAQPDLRKTVLDAMADPDVESKALSKWLSTEKGCYLSHRSISRHRTGGCRG